jgi:signal transduction histidine kinase
MKTLLVIAQHPESAESLRAALRPDQYRIIQRLDVAEAEPVLASGMTDACLLDVESMQIQGLWAVEKIRAHLPHRPLIVLTGPPPWEWAEQAYVLGAAHVLAKPIGPRMLSTLLERCWTGVASSLPPPASPPPVPPPSAPARSNPANSGSVQTLKGLRDFSAVLSESLRAEPMLRQFLLLLREIIGVNRAAIFLRQPAFSFTASSSPESRRCFRSACALGLSPGLLEHFELSFESGIGAYLFRQGRILRRDNPVVQQDREMQKEFELLGAEVAIPILDRESLVGLAAFDGRVTGESLSNNELELIFHLLEQLGLAVKNIWLYDQLAANHEMLADILRHLSSACVVVSRDLTLLHANRAAQKLFAPEGRRSALLEFSDLPHLLGTKLYQVLQTGNALAPFPFEPPGHPGAVYQVAIVPIQKHPEVLPASALLMVEDQTQAQQLRQLELEAANLRLVKSMADRLAHEIGNAMVPMATHQQLLGERFRDPEFRVSLDAALTDGVKRVTRLVQQMRYLARDSLMAQDPFPLAPLLEEAFQEASKYQPVKSAQLKYEEDKKPILVTGDRAALKHAFAELLLNALQANTADASIGVILQSPYLENGQPWVRIEVEDNGAGFTAEAAKTVPAPFFTTRTVGLGLGLSVCHKIIEMHQGKLEIVLPKKERHGIVRILLPAPPPHPAPAVAPKSQGEPGTR